MPSGFPDYTNPVFPIDLSDPALFVNQLLIASGGTGTATPALVAGTGISISGAWPNQTVTNTSPGSALGDPVTVAHGGWGSTDGSYAQSIKPAGSLIFNGTATKQVTGGPEYISCQAPLANHVALWAGITTDTNGRFLIGCQGFVEWGPGGAGDQDIALFRNAASSLHVQNFNNLTSDHLFSVNKTTNDGSTGAALLRVNNSGTPALVHVENGAFLAINGAPGSAPLDVLGVSGGLCLRAITPASADGGLYMAVSGDTFARLAIDGAGDMAWTDGAHAADAQLQRIQAGQLNMIGAVGFGVQRSGDTNPRAFLEDGTNTQLSLGPGNAVTDVVVRRNATGGLELYAGGTNQDIALNPSGSGSTLAGKLALSGAVTKVNNVATAGEGVPAVYGQGFWPNQGGAIGAQTIATAPSKWIFRFSAYAVCSTAGTGGTLNVTLNWTDDSGAQSLNVILGLSLTTKGNYASATQVVEAIAGSTITYSAALGGGSGNPKYGLYVALEKIG